MIDRNHPLPLTKQAPLLGISRSSLYYLPKPVSQADVELMHRLDELHLEYPFMGARMLCDQLGLSGIQSGRRRVGTLMKRMGIQALYRKPGTSKKHPGHKVYPYLLRGMAINQANQVWALDTTYIRMAKGFVYLTAVVGYYHRPNYPSFSPVKM
ncbi:IS3 family transposase [Desulfobulbus alkaliphilus]|nr:IS3 family transposase [Desulfobulbus alkaliphilus]